ncbi:MAG: hypothetical protein QNK24_16710 [Desulfuromusa sp.]|nr:hypothetical protein [Desulfuromusa sp.]
MKKQSALQITVQTLLITGISIFALAPAHAENPVASATQSSSGQDQEQSQQQDKTGTNPVNFTKDIRVYSEYSWLNTAGDGNQSLTTTEFRTPFADGKWQWRVRARFNALKADLNDDDVEEIDESGFGDIDMRFLTVPYLDMAKQQAVAVGLEVFLDTASEDALGSGTTSLGPQVFYVKFLPTGLFAPALQYKFSVDEATGRNETDQILIDLNYLRMAKDKQSWFFVDPQIIIDNEAETEYSIVDFEFGVMMSKWTDLQGHSLYIRPSVGVGADRPVDYSVEVGYKIVGF